jgi:hypothetical protein
VPIWLMISSCLQARLGMWSRLTLTVFTLTGLDLLPIGMSSFTPTAGPFLVLKSIAR